MGAKYNPKRDKHFEAVKAAAKTLGKEILAPEILFRRASSDDIDVYTPEMLALTAAHAHRALSLRGDGQPAITVETVEGIAPGGNAVSILAVTDRNMPFLYDSVMGEVTSTHRDIHLAIHPIIVAEDGKPAKLFDPEEKATPATG